MAYAKKTWVSGETPLSAENMNNIENGIADAHEDISKLNTKLKNVGTKTFNQSVTISAAETYTVTVDASLAGCIPIGIIDIKNTTTWVLCTSFFIADNTATLIFRNLGTSQTSFGTSFRVLYAPE